ncbi:MAG: helix-hairpin-helix domain-containing protein [Planctomycetota bacterium]
MNRADADRLVALHGIGPALAQRIVEHREAHGPFADTDALQDVLGIGPRTAARIAPWVRFD